MKNSDTAGRSQRQTYGSSSPKKQIEDPLELQSRHQGTARRSCCQDSWYGSESVHARLVRKILKSLTVQLTTRPGNWRSW